MSIRMQIEFDANYDDRNPMKMKDILTELRGLSRSQGCWGRILEHIGEIQEYDTREYLRLKKDLEYEEFTSLLDLVEFFEEGKHTSRYYDKKAAEGYKVYKIDIRRERIDTTCVLAKTPADAKRQAIALTDPGCYEPGDEGDAEAYILTAKNLDPRDKKQIASIGAKL